MGTTTGSRIRARLTAALLLTLILSVTRRSGAADLSFALTPEEGTGLVSFAGGTGASLDGKDLGVTSVTGLATPLNGPSTTLAIDNGRLDFKSGSFTSGSPDGTEWNFSNGGSTLTINGTIPSLGITTPTVLLSGGFAGSTFVKSDDTNDFKISGSAVFSVVDPTLASFFGLPTGATAYKGLLSTTFLADGSSPAGYSSNGFSDGNLTVAPVPEPGAFLVFAATFAAAAISIRHRRRAA